MVSDPTTLPEVIREINRISQRQIEIGTARRGSLDSDVAERMSTEYAALEARIARMWELKRELMNAQEIARDTKKKEVRRDRRGERW